MSINSVQPGDLATHRKMVSDKKDNNPELSIADSSSNNPRSRAYKNTRDLKSAMELNNTIMSYDDEVYFENLLNS